MNVERLLRCGVAIGLFATMGLLARPADARSAAGPGFAPGLWLQGRIYSEDSDAFGKCLDVVNWGIGPDIQMWPCHGGWNQHWKILWNGNNGHYIFVNSQSNECIDAVRGGRQQLRQLPCDGTYTQEFILHKVGPSRSWAVESVSRLGQCMDVIDWGRGQEVYLYDCHFGDNQLWWFAAEPRPGTPT